MRWAGPTHAGAGPSGNRPNIQSPPSTCSRASARASVVIHTLKFNVDVKNHLIVLSDAGSCTRP